MRKVVLGFFVCICVLFLGLLPAMANPVDLGYAPNSSGQDVMTPPWTEELGTGFPVDELISTSWTTTTYIPCPRDYDSGGPSNIEVTMTNLTNRAFYKVAYVKDPETSITNDDLLLINGQEAFLIDKIGINTPLIYESMVQDTVFEPGETWKFVIQNYSNTLGLAASAFGSYGVGNQSGGDLISSGSIIPEPATLILLGLGGLALLKRKR
jgi:hypothetical protein